MLKTTTKNKDWWLGSDNIWRSKVSIKITLGSLQSNENIGCRVLYCVCVCARVFVYVNASIFYSGFSLQLLKHNMVWATKTTTQPNGTIFEFIVCIDVRYTYLETISVIGPVFLGPSNKYMSFSQDCLFSLSADISLCVCVCVWALFIASFAFLCALFLERKRNWLLFVLVSFAFNF